jgi:hypothetical protein
MFIIYKMDCQKLLIYGLVALIGLYFLRETCGLKLPFLDTQEGFLDGLLDNSNGANMNTNGVASNNNVAVANNNVALANNNVAGPTNGVRASEELGDETFLRVSGINRTPTSCYPQNTLKPKDLLPSGKSKAVQDFDNANPTGEGILKGVNFLDAGFHVGINTVGQSLRNANRQLRSEPPNPQVAVSPWLNTTIGPDLGRKPLEDEDVCLNNQPTNNGALSQVGQVA